jgi:GNAT superfamily N-acetyltransferase
MDTVSIQTAGVADLPLLLQHRRGMFRDMGHTAEDVLDRMQEASERFLREALQDGSYHAWIVKVDGRPAASGGLHFVTWIPGCDDPGPRRAWVHGVFTDPAFRRRGLARRLMEEIVAWCRQEGCRAVLLHATDQGRPIYESLGFKPSNEMRLEL